MDKGYWGQGREIEGGRGRGMETKRKTQREEYRYTSRTQYIQKDRLTNCFFILWFYLKPNLHSF